MADDRVIAPGGYCDRSQLCLIEPGSTIDAGGDLAPQIEQVNRTARLSPEFTDPPQLRSTTNWISAAWWLNRTGTSITYFRTKWKVPRDPVTQVVQSIYLFSGMQPAKCAPLQTILQPVLAWGEIGPCWSVASYLVPDSTGHTCNTPHIPVNPGDVLTGVIRLIDQNGWRFAYSCEFEGIAGTGFSVINMPEMVWCVETLEAYEQTGTPPYDLNKGSEYPDAKRTAFRRIRIESEVALTSLHWIPHNYQSKFGERTKVVSKSSTRGKIDIFYH
jgi:hypothetical protein